MAVLYLCRHGRTPFNYGDNPLYPGSQLRASSEIPLDDVGRQEAADVARKLRNRGIVQIITSDLTRTIQTAQIIQKALNVPLALDSRLDTWDLGLLSGLSEGLNPIGPDVEGPPIDPIILWYERHPKERAIGGESFNDFLKRVKSGITEWETMSGGPLCLVTHGRILDVLDFVRGYSDVFPIEIEDRPATGAIMRVTPGQPGVDVIKMADVQTIYEDARG